MHHFVFKGILIILNIVCASLFALPAQIMIIRHAETDFNDNLNAKGLERAGALAPFIEKTDFLLEYGPPLAIFAGRPSVDESTQKCLETVGPTAELLMQSIHTGFAKWQELELANFILNHSDYNGKNLLICWYQDRIQHLAIALGATSAAPFPNVYDQIWVIKYASPITLTIFQQQLLFGDSP